MHPGSATGSRAPDYKRNGKNEERSGVRRGNEVRGEREVRPLGSLHRGGADAAALEVGVQVLEDVHEALALHLALGDGEQGAALGGDAAAGT